MPLGFDRYGINLENKAALNPYAYLLFSPHLNSKYYILIISYNLSNISRPLSMTEFRRILPSG